MSSSQSGEQPVALFYQARHDNALSLAHAYFSEAEWLSRKAEDADDAHARLVSGEYAAFVTSLADNDRTVYPDHPHSPTDFSNEHRLIAIAHELLIPKLIFMPTRYLDESIPFDNDRDQAIAVAPVIPDNALEAVIAGRIGPWLFEISARHHLQS